MTEFASHMRPAGGLDNPIADEQLIEPSVTIGVNDPKQAIVAAADVVGVSYPTPRSDAAARYRARRRLGLGGW